MRNALFLLAAATVMVLLCWVVKYGGVEDVTVRVVDKATGNPVEGYWVFYHAHPDSRYRRVPEVERVTHETVCAVPRNCLGGVDLWFAALGYRPRLLRPSELSWSSWLRFGETVVALEPGPVLKGTVRDAEGRPVAEAAILSEMRPLLQDAPMPEPIARTGADGTFESPDVRPFIGDVKAFKEGLGAGHCAVSEGMDLSIQSGKTTCRMLDAGKPIAGLWVIAESYAGTEQQSSPWWQAAQKTNAQGEVRLEAFPAGRTRIWTQQINRDGSWQNYFLFDDEPMPSGSVFVDSGSERKLEKWVEVEKDKTVECVIDVPAGGDRR